MVFIAAPTDPSGGMSEGGNTLKPYPKIAKTLERLEQPLSTVIGLDPKNEELITDIYYYGKPCSKLFGLIQTSL